MTGELFFVAAYMDVWTSSARLLAREHWHLSPAGEKNSVRPVPICR